MTPTQKDILCYRFLWCDVSNVPFGNAEIGNVVRDLDVAIGKVLELRDRLYELRKSCTHNWIESGCHAVCSECGKKQDGWWCDTSPDKQCHYPGETEDTADDYGENCIYCGQPDERK